jgi:hypothetical protein
MATEKLMITISGLQDHEVILASDSQHGKALHQVDLFQADDSPPRAPACPEGHQSSKIAKAPQEAAGTVVGGQKPWEQASGDPTAINFRPDMSLHAKMEWVCDNVPKMSRLRILREGAELLCNMIIEKHHREPGK